VTFAALLSRCRPAPVATLAAVLSLTATAHAQGSSEAAATALFDEGRRLMSEHKFADACPKLAESERLAPSGGTLLNLADCYEHTGQSASAWVAWKDVASRANAAGKGDVEKRALARAAALEPTLSKLTIAVDGASDVQGLDLKRDGIAVGHTEFGLPIPVDPGPHVVEATAPRKKAFTAKVDVAAKQTDARVTVALEDAPEAASPPASATPPSALAPEPRPGPAPAAQGSALKTVGVVIGVAGLAGIAVGSVFGVEARSKNQTALEPQNCRTSTLCTPNGLSLTSDARNAATISTIGFVAGGALVAGGVIVWLVAPSTATTRSGVRVAPLLSASTAGLTVDAGW